MLKIDIPDQNLWDPVKEEFIDVKGKSLMLEHSLLSLSKWESKWCVPFLGKDEKTTEQTIDYIKCMTVTQNVEDDIYDYLTAENIKQVTEYIDAKMTATWFSGKQEKGKINGQTITSELIYYWMISLQIPFECQKWHLNRLLTLIKVVSIKNAPPKKMSRNDTLRNNAAENARRKAMLHTKG